MTSPILAEDLRPKNLPQCVKYTVAAGVVCGYEDLEDWKSVLRADAELTLLREKLKSEKAASEQVAIQLQAAIAEAGAREHGETILKEQNDKLTKDLIKLDEKYQTERVKPAWGSPIAWTIAGVSTAILAGFVVHSLVD